MITRVTPTVELVGDDVKEAAQRAVWINWDVEWHANENGFPCVVVRAQQPFLLWDEFESEVRFITTGEIPSS